MHLSKKKFKYIRDKLIVISPKVKKAYNNQFDRIDEFLSCGDTQPAIVKSVEPLIISAYSDELDAVIFLRFPDVLVDKYKLKIDDRLVTSNIYERYVDGFEKDISPGDFWLGRYSNYNPLVQLFLSDEEDFIRKRIELFDEDKWKRVEMLTQEKHNNGKFVCRYGFYCFNRY
ncbi:MAG: hypothetical protein J6P57_01210 [Lachnospiraceae bacterium]|nr:hypothetical protein [Lachnospiraceae bacterium]